MLYDIPAGRPREAAAAPASSRGPATPSSESTVLRDVWSGQKSLYLSFLFPLLVVNLNVVYQPICRGCRSRVRGLVLADRKCTVRRVSFSTPSPGVIGWRRMGAEGATQDETPRSTS